MHFRTRIAVVKSVVCMLVSVLLRLQLALSWFAFPRQLFQEVFERTSRKRSREMIISPKKENIIRVVRPRVLLFSHAAPSLLKRTNNLWFHQRCLRFSLGAKGSKSEAFSRLEEISGDTQFTGALHSSSCAASDNFGTSGPQKTRSQRSSKGRQFFHCISRGKARRIFRFLIFLVCGI